MASFSDGPVEIPKPPGHNAPTDWYLEYLCEVVYMIAKQVIWGSQGND